MISFISYEHELISEQHKKQIDAQLLGENINLLVTIDIKDEK